MRLGLSTALASLAFLVAGIAWPQAAETLLRLLLVTLALGYVVVRALDAGLPERTTRDSYSPFDSFSTGRPPSPIPPAIRHLADHLAGVDDAAVAARRTIPWPVARTVVEAASRRLADGHGLRLDEPDHHPRIRALVAEPTWLLLAPSDPGPDAGAPPGHEWRPVPLSRLAGILDDVEAL